MKYQNSVGLKEEDFEEEVIDILSSLGWELTEKINRDNTKIVFDFSLLAKQIQIINNVSDELVQKTINRIKKINDTLENMNKECWDLLVEGIKIYDEQTKLTKTIQLISQDSTKNKYQVVRQLEVSNGSQLRIPDLVLFINGLPVVVMELKSSLAREDTESAWQQNETLKTFSPKLWAFNVMNFVSNRNISLYGSTTASLKRMHKVKNWKTKENINIIEYLFNKDNFYKFISTFSFFSLENNSYVKYMAAPHQITAVENTMARLRIAGDNRGGVVWHTQGSGKSVTMLMLAKSIIKEVNNATIIVVTDRNTLDKQLLYRFLDAKEYLRNEAVAIASRKDLVKKLKDKKYFGIYFSTVQKFVEDTGVLTLREDIFVLVDEAHRTQNNIDGIRTLNKETKEFLQKFGFARYMRNAFPNAKMVGFTGTPLMKLEKDTTHVFGDYTHIYSMKDAVADEATVPIYYEMRNISYKLDEKYTKEMDLIQQKYVETLKSDDLASQQKMDTLLKSIEAKQVLENDEVIRVKANDMLLHLDKRKEVLHGKAMIVAVTRRAAFKYYKIIREIVPELKDKVILVMTESNKDEPEMASAIVAKRDINKVAEEFRKPNSQYQIAIVVDMWLTGYDVPDLDTIYLDKIIKWHNLMQAVARVNRTYEDNKNNKVKNNGLVVDYIGIWKFLADALRQYASGTDQKIDFTIEDINKAKEKLLECFVIINESYIKDLYQFSKLNSKEQYQFVISSYEEILKLDLAEKNKFISLARKTKRFFKMSYTVINQEEAILAKGIDIINALISRNSIETDDNLQDTIKLIKGAIAKAIDSEVSDVLVSDSKSTSQDINEIAKTLEKEAKDLAKSSPRVAIELMKHSIQAQLISLKNIKPVFYKNASEKLKEIVNSLATSHDVEELINNLIILSKEVVKEKAKPSEFEDVQLQAFFDVLSNDDYLKNHQTSEVLKRLATEIVQKVKECGTEQFENNPQVRDNIKHQLRLLLKRKYNYPPDYLNGISCDLVEQVTEQVKVDKEYFKKDD